MRNIKILPYLLSITTLVFVIGCSVSHDVRRVKEIDPMRGGIYYRLPETVLVIKIPIKVSMLKATKLGEKFNSGTVALTPSQKYAVAGYPNIKIENTTKYGFLEPDISSRTRADSKSLFFVDVRSKCLVSNEIITELTETGLIMTGESAKDDISVEYAAKAIEFTAGTVGKVIGLAGTDPDREDDAIIEFAEQIKSIQNNRMELIRRPTTRLPADTFQKHLDALNEAEETIKSYFRKKKTVVWNATFEISQINDYIGKSICLAEVRKESDIYELILNDRYLVNKMPEDFSGDFKKEQAIHLKIAYDGEKSKVKKKKNSEGVESDITIPFEQPTGFVYRVPVNATIVVSNDLDIEKRVYMPIAQLGPMVSLPAKPGGNNSTYNVSFHVDTGALKKATLSSKPPQTTAIEALTAGTGTVLDSVAKRRAERDAKKDELNQLERKAKILDYKSKIKELEEKLYGEAEAEITTE